MCDEAVFGGFYNENYVALRNFVYYKNGDLDAAEDIVQESFMKIWNNCKEIIFNTVRSYLFTIANRLFLNSVRHEKVKLNFASKTGASIDKETPEFQAIHNEFKDKLETAIASLPEKQRVVFLMNRIDKKTFKEIAESLDISVKTVEKRMSLCLKQLKSEVEELKKFKI